MVQSYFNSYAGFLCLERTVIERLAKKRLNFNYIYEHLKKMPGRLLKIAELCQIQGKKMEFTGVNE